MALILIAVVFVGLYAFNHAGISQGTRESLNYVLFILIVTAIALGVLAVVAPGGPGKDFLKLLQ